MTGTFPGTTKSAVIVAKTMPSMYSFDRSAFDSASWAAIEPSSADPWPLSAYRRSSIPLRVRIHSSVVSMSGVSASLRTTFFGTPIPLPVMTDFMGARCAPSCVSLRVQRKQVVFVEPILAAAELTHHFRAAGIDHLAQLVGREECQRRERALRAAC